MRNEMCLISLRDIISDNFDYEYRGEIPNECLSAYHYIIEQLGLNINFTGMITGDCPQTYITHCCKTDIEFEMFGYRRIQIREYIKAQYNNYIITSEEIVKPKYIIVSDPRKAVIELIEKVAYGDKVKMIYDKTDKWEAIKPFTEKLDKLCLEYADVITYSAKGLKPEGYEYKSYYVPNGNKFYNLPLIEKYNTPTAIYAGNNIEKFNGQVLYMLAELYPEWNFIVYVTHDEKSEHFKLKPPNVEFRSPIPQEELIQEIAKCHVGLLLFYNDKWERGMLPLKFFNYINVGIPTLYTSVLEQNLEDYGDVAFSLSDVTLDELLNTKADYTKYYRDWNNVIDELTDIWEIPDEA